MKQVTDMTLPPFPAFPSTERYVAVGTIAEAVNRVGRAISAREPAALVIGPPGTGKSLLAELIAQRYASSRQVVTLGDVPMRDSDALLRHLLHHLGVDSRCDDPHLALVDYLKRQSDQEAGLLVIVDEAHKLSVEVIEAIRMVTNITRAGKPRVFALLCGGPKLDETLVDSSLESFAQRAATRCYLHPFNAEETRQYIHQTIAACSGDAEGTVTAEAIAAVHHACCGVPRLINQLMTEAIDCAADTDREVIDESIVDRAWAQLQQLPSPLVESAELGHQSVAIEFGELAAEEGSLQEHAGPAWEPPSILAEQLANSDQPAAGIELESSSACWIEETAEQPQQPEQPEQHLCDVLQTAGEVLELFGQFENEEEIAVGTGFSTRLAAPPVAPTDLESLLHAEIVAAGPFDAEYADAPPPAEIPKIQLHRYDEEEDRNAPAGCQDDSDLLIIEDDVDVLPMDWCEPPPGPAHEVTVDFQSMLARMRSGE